MESSPSQSRDSDNHFQNMDTIFNEEDGSSELFGLLSSNFFFAGQENTDDNDDATENIHADINDDVFDNFKDEETGNICLTPLPFPNVSVHGNIPMSEERSKDMLEKRVCERRGDDLDNADDYQGIRRRIRRLGDRNNEEFLSELQREVRRHSLSRERSTLLSVDEVGIVEMARPTITNRTTLRHHGSLRASSPRKNKLPRYVVKSGKNRYGVKLKLCGRNVRIGCNYPDSESASIIAEVAKKFVVMKEGQLSVSLDDDQAKVEVFEYKGTKKDLTVEKRTVQLILDDFIKLHNAKNCWKLARASLTDERHPQMTVSSDHESNSTATSKSHPRKVEVSSRATPSTNRDDPFPEHKQDTQQLYDDITSSYTQDLVDIKKKINAMAHFISNMIEGGTSQESMRILEVITSELESLNSMLKNETSSHAASLQ